MSNTIHANLSWLPRPPVDFSSRCKRFPDDGRALGTWIQYLAGHALNINQLNRVANLIAEACCSKKDLAPLVPFRLGLVSNATTSLIVPALVATAARHGLALEVIDTSFDQVAQEALRPDAIFSKARPDAVLIAVDYRGLPFRNAVGNNERCGKVLDEALRHLQMIREGLRKGCGTPNILQTIARPPEALFGNYDSRLPGTFHGLVDSFNRVLIESLQGSDDLLLDVAGLAEIIGLANWHDPVQWHMAKLPFSQALVPLYADHVCRLIAAMRGKSRRCLILDLDNTLWGGVIGDDDLEGIVLGQGDPTGEAFLAIQRLVLDLRNRGIVLAVSSKNDDATARLPFQKHPDMLLKEHHIAIFQANWNDKATNIKAIADALSLGLDSFVFLDDNPAERAQVRQALPQVAVPELPADPALYPRTLMAAGYFEAVSFSEEDLKRADYYRADARRIALKEQVADLQTYLRSLEMVITFSPFDGPSRGRIFQLSNKSNQFNLTTRRYTEAEIHALETDPFYFTLQVRLSDIFGDNGMISVVVCRKGGQTWKIDAWLMSCRVLGRQVEEAVLQEVILHAKAEGANELIGVYIPTSRNKMAEDHYAKLGFTRVESFENAHTVWRLSLDAVSRPDVLMEIRRAGLDLVNKT